MTTKFFDVFEMQYQIIFAPLLHNTHQTDLFRRTNKLHEELFLDLVSRILKPDFFLEIGAYEAATARKVASRLINTECYAFEADPENFQKFKNEFQEIKLQNFHYLHRAISNHDGFIEFHKQNGVQCDLLPNNSILPKIHLDMNTGYEIINVSSCRIDSFFKNALDIKNKSFVLRIDVEGLCYEVLQGAANTLNSCLAVYAEVEDYEIWKDQKTVFEIYQFLEELGFIPVTRDIQTPGQYNVLWLRMDTAFDRRFRSRISLYLNELHLLCDIAKERFKSG
jgi:FkbM family methyltransferase